MTSLPAGDLPTTELPRRATIPAEVLFQAVDDGVVLLDLRGDRYYTMNPVASRIWTMLAERVEVPEVLETIARTYEVDAADLRRDLAHFLDELASAGLVELA